MTQKIKLVPFTEQELQAFEAICNYALAAGGVKVAPSVVHFLQKFNSITMTDSPEPTHAQTIGK